LQFQVNGTTPSVTLNTLGAIGVGSTPNYGTSGQALVSGGSTAAPTWASVTTSPAGSNTQIQYNNAGAFGASSNLTWNGSALAVTGAINATGGISGTAGANISGAGWGVLPYVANSLVLDNNSGESRFFATGANSTTDGSFLFYTGQTDGGANERFRIGTAGQFGIGGANYGTAGQVLTSGGASAAPSWATAGGGSWTYLSTVTASNAATADVETTFNSTYDMYAIVVTGLTPGNTTDGWYSRLKVGGSYQTTNYSYNQLYLKADSTTVSSRATTNGGFIPIGYANDVNSFSSFVIYVPNPSSTSVKKSTYWTGFSQYSDLMNTFMGSAMYTGSTSALTGVRIYAAGGNLTGTFRLYGIKNS